jgi:hypothetical protein
MTHNRSFAMMLVPALALLPALTALACVGNSTSDTSEVGVIKEAIPAGGAHLVGTYDNSDNVTAGDLSRIVLKVDGTFHTETFVECIKAPCCPASQDGHYGLYRQDTTTYFELFDGVTGVFIDKFQYVLMGDYLNVRRLSSTADGRWLSMQRAPAAWCMTNNDCREQDLLPGPCAGEYVCQDANICNYHCGTPTQM